MDADYILLPGQLPKIMEELTTSYCEYALNLVEANCKLLQPDLLLIDGSLASMSVILSSGDQVALETPGENLDAMVNASKLYGGYE